MYVRSGPKQSNRGMQVTLRRRLDAWTPIAYLGFSNTTVRVAGPTLVLKEQGPFKFSFLYDANGKITWNFNGTEHESFIKEKGALCPSDHKAVIGDRVASTYCSIEGVIRKLSITPVQRQPFGFHAEGRLAFERAEKDAKVTFCIDNPFSEAVTGCRAVVLQKNAAGRKVGQSDRRTSPGGDTRLRCIQARTRRSGLGLRGGRRLRVEHPLEHRRSEGGYVIRARDIASGLKRAIKIK